MATGRGTEMVATKSSIDIGPSSGPIFNILLGTTEKNSVSWQYHSIGRLDA